MPGGVCAVLDYDVGLMAEYVAEMTTRLSTGHNYTDDRFRSFIRQVLNSTRLPSTTILLGMNYLAKRINIMKSMGQSTKLSDGQMWRYLTVALLLGSKFLDDNTFQNRSWSEVSAIPVKELNTLERDWMNAIDWKLYVNLDTSADYQAWLKNWKEWLDTKKRQQLMASRSALIPSIETDLGRSRHQPIRSPYSPTGYPHQSSEQMHQQSYRPQEVSWPSYGVQQGMWHNAPLTPPDSGYNTPEYLDSAATMQYSEWFPGHQVSRQPSGVFVDNTYQQPPPYVQQPVSQNGFQAQNRGNFPAYNGYNSHVWDHAPYFGAGHGYGQPVMG